MSDTIETQVEEAGKGAGGCLAVLGVLNIIFGLAAIGSPWVAGTAVTMVIGALLLLSGIFEIVHTYTAGGWKAGIFAFLGGALAIIGGGLILARPMLGLAMLTLILIAYFVVDGIQRSVLALKIKPTPGWGWLLFSGVASVILGLYIWRDLPSSTMVIGVLVGIRILLSGWSMLFLGIAARQISKAVDAEA